MRLDEAAGAPHSAESAIRSACDGGDYERAATLVIEHYGREILGFLITRLRSEDAASEVFSQFSEDLWMGLPRFEWRCSMRTWAYKLARHGSLRQLERAKRIDQRNVPISRLASLSQVVARVRSETGAYLKSEVKTRMQELRAQLPTEDQTILVLRVDRRLSWLSLAEVMSRDAEVLDELALKREAARLRKRFQAIKDKLRRLAEADGLISGA